MVEDKQIPIDIAVIGGGPAGISACLELSKSESLKIALFEKDSELGGMPRSCHIFFGMRDLRKIMTGPGYARRLNTMVRKTSVEIHTNSTVIEIVPGRSNERHRINVVSPRGFHSYNCQVILITTGCFEISQGARMIPGTRPDGIFTTGALQDIINIKNSKPGNRALIIGSEHIALSSAITLKKKGISIVGMIEKDPKLHTFSSVARVMSLYYRFPIYRSVSVQAILGNSQVEGVELTENSKKTGYKIACDLVILTGRFRPYCPLTDFLPIQIDQSSHGPIIDMNYMTSIPNIYAAGNVLRGADMHDLCALEGKSAAKSILKRFESSECEDGEVFYLKAEPPIRYVVPQKILLDKIKPVMMPHLRPGCSVQLDHSMGRSVLEAWSSNRLIWRKSYSQLIANNRIPIPIWKFDLSRIDRKSGVILRLQN